MSGFHKFNLATLAVIKVVVVVSKTSRVCEVPAVEMAWVKWHHDGVPVMADGSATRRELWGKRMNENG